MEQKNDQSAASRKAGRKRGEVTQKMVTFRLDSDLLAWVNSQPNKGRYINNLIRSDYEHNNEGA